jgi:hypothetical protein
VSVRVWEGERGRHRGGIESVCTRVWEGEREKDKEGRKRVSVLECGREREEDIEGARKCLCESVGGRDMKTKRGGRE